VLKPPELHTSTHVKLLDYCHGIEPITIHALGRGGVICDHNPSVVRATILAARTGGIAPEGDMCFSDVFG
jgi:hypothetical protein